MRVKEIMSAPAVTVAPASTVHEAIGTMLDHRVGSVIVVDAGVVGILTRSDALRGAYYTGESLDDIAVTRVMSENVVTTAPSTSVRSALETMGDHNIKKLPVVEDLSLVGIVTMTDIASQLPARVREVREQLDRKDEWTS